MRPKKEFTHQPESIPSLRRIDGGKFRLYETPTGVRYPSVTSVIGWEGRHSLDAWREKVGAETAERIGREAANRGTAVHEYCERYLKNEEVSPMRSLPVPYQMFRAIAPILEDIDVIRALETPLFSHHLRVAGTTDCVANFRGRRSIIDFKTSSRPKTADQIHGYFKQAACYAVCFEELTGIPVPNIAIIMTVKDGKPLVFLEKRDTWIGPAIQSIEGFYRDNPTVE